MSKRTRQDIPGLREASAAEAAAVALIDDIKERMTLAEAEIVLRRRDRDALAQRLANGEHVTGADLRKADEGIADAEATVTLLTEALPKTGRTAMDARRARETAERQVKAQIERPYRAALVEAEAGLKAAQDAHALALANTRELPASAADEMDELLDWHGRNKDADWRTSELRRIFEFNQTNKKYEGTHLQKPMMAWP